MKNIYFEKLLDFIQGIVHFFFINISLRKIIRQKGMTTIAKIKLYSPVALALVLLCISIVLIVITFSLVYWLHEISTGNNYGMWQGCLKGGDICGRWYENGQRLLNYNMTGK